MAGHDFKKDHKELYTGKAGRMDEVDVPKLHYLGLDTIGDISTEIGPAIGALYAVAYPLKFAVKERDPAREYVVMPPEAIYPGKREMYAGPRERWAWTALVLQPVTPTAAELRAAVRKAREKGVPRVDEIRLLTLSEGHAVQTLHLGPYAEEGATIERLHAYMAERGYAPGGAHHEIYLSDPMRTAPERIKTLLRQPVTPVRARIAAAAR